MWQSVFGHPPFNNHDNTLPTETPTVEARGTKMKGIQQTQLTKNANPSPADTHTTHEQNNRNPSPADAHKTHEQKDTNPTPTHARAAHEKETEIQRCGRTHSVRIG